MRCKINNKAESKALVKKLGLAPSNGILVTKGTTYKEIYDFVEGCEFVCIRAPVPEGRSDYGVLLSTVPVVLARRAMDLGEESWTISPTLIEYHMDHMVIQFTSKIDLEGNIVVEFNIEPGISHREAMERRETFIGDLHVFELRYPEVRPVFDIIYEHDLFDCFVEVTVYSTLLPHGIPFVVWEVRDY